MIPPIILAIFIHPCLNNNFFTDVFWTISMYLEAVILIPLSRKMHKYTDNESFTNHFIAI